ncbi:HD domain-containing protein [Ktedonospora formicarum]|uniref:Polynucleotide adenylyltransferase n=1 Tax=Ktedonospora formicarum TaxID=2778364 RepID=A0A8J3I3E7_9CHLR|nr:HD domain-containing protein [Ktedonospora formicarum]GHO45288.1 polynucleotide adenylyltransferase [Ktedonospora formicarum]
MDAQTRTYLQHITTFFAERNIPAYLVGGSVRDLLLARPCKDWDIALPGETPAIARQLANTLGGFFAHMNDKACRITLHRADGSNMMLDISPWRGSSIEEDLHARDFTLNAIAIALPELLTCLEEGAPLNLIDPLYGRVDLEAHTLRVVSEHALRDDPLRILRAIRFSIEHELRIEPHTASLLKRDASLLSTVAVERIHDELYAILRFPNVTQHLRLLDDYGIFTTLIPEFLPARGMPQPSLHHWDVFEHSLETPYYLQTLEQLLEASPQELRTSPLTQGDSNDLVDLQALLQEAEQQDIFHLDTLSQPEVKLATLLHDIGKTVTYEVDEEGNIHFYHHPQAGVPLVQSILSRLGSNTADRRLAQLVAAHHMRPGQLSHDNVTPRAIRRYFVDLGPTGILVALVALADHLAMRGPLPLTEAWGLHLATVRLLCERYIRVRDSILPPRLLQADELMHRLELKPGPIVGQLLEAIAEAQAEGIVRSKQDALWLASEKLEEQREPM